VKGGEIGKRAVAKKRIWSSLDLGTSSKQTVARIAMQFTIYNLIYTPTLTPTDITKAKPVKHIHTPQPLYNALIAT
jgi:hypothetical protein